MQQTLQPIVQKNARYNAPRQLALHLPKDEFSVRRSLRAKRLRVSINPVGEVEVVAPRNASIRDVQRFVEARETWISHHRNRIQSMRTAELNSLKPECIDLPALDKSWDVSYILVSREQCKNRKFNSSIVTNGSFLNLYIVNDKDIDNQVSKLLKQWLTDVAKRSLIPWLNKVSCNTGIDFNSTKIRGQRTRWASCSAQKNINLNRCMLFLEPEQVNYLMVHELCHTRHMNHSSNFWNLVERHVPGYMHQEKLVNKACFKLPRWAY